MAKTVDIVEKSLTVPILNPLLKRLGADKVKLRASLCASQLVGLGVMRYAVRAKPIHRWTSTLSSTRWLRRCSGISPARSPDATDKWTQGVNSAFTGEN
jgi:hypothetical protein